jgi:5-methyltetrahydrofolate--homocysteine methyltransferase
MINERKETLMIDGKTFALALLEGDAEKVKLMIRESLNLGEKAETILNEGLIPAMDQVGVKFKNDEIYLPEVLIAARAMHEGMALLKPKFSKTGASGTAKIVIGTVTGDLHDIGKNLVGMMLEGGGFEVIDVGVNASAEQFVRATKEHGANVVALSALLTTTMLEMKSIIEAVKTAGLTPHVKTIVGGAPVTEGFARLVGADGYAPDAASAVDKVRELLARGE